MSTNDITIRKAIVEDFPSILSLIKEFSIFQRTPEKVSVTLEQMIKEKFNFQCLVVELKDKEIAGFASFFFTYYSWSGKALYLDDLYIKEVYRKHGLGKQLLESVIALANQEGCLKVRWQVSKWNSNAIDFYRKIGAAIDETEINCDLSLVSNATSL